MKNKEIIEKVSEVISKIVPNCCGVTLGGSRAHNLCDEYSDVELYFYSTDSIPSIEDINNCMSQLNAKHKRCEEFLWNEYPWGPHSFFVIDDLYFEIGYRIISDIEKKIIAYMEGNVAPKKDCHDLGLGYVYSGLAASVCSEKILLSFNTEIENLKITAKQFPDKLYLALEEEYLDTAKNMIDGKLLNAVRRCDLFFYEVLSSRIIRALMIMAFAKSGTHFPGDKWNEVLLNKTNWDKKDEFIKIIKEHYSLDSAIHENMLKKYNLLVEAYDIVKKG